MNNEKYTISLEEAIKCLPDRGVVHTFRQAGTCLLGADHERKELIESMSKAKEIEVTGPAAQGMGHGLAICDNHGWLFIETANKPKEPHHE